MLRLQLPPQWPQATAISLVTVLALLWAPVSGAKEGFGRFTKKTSQMIRVRPPEVFLTGTKIAVRAEGTASRHAGLASRLARQLESEVLGRDQRLSSASRNPETLIELTVLRNDSDESWESRTETIRQKVGTDSRGKAIYRTRQVKVRYKILNHAFAAAFKVTEPGTGRSLVADTLEVSFRDDYREGQGAPETFQLEDRAIRSVVEQIARKITPTPERLSVLLPKGSLGDLANLAKAGLWNQYLEALESMAPLRKREDEAYRQYAIGTAYEALGYGADDPEVTLRYLEKADLHYRQAIEANPREKFFTKDYDALLSSKEAEAPLDRVRTALIDYRRLLDFQQSGGQPRTAQENSGAKELERAEADDLMDNSAVIRMVRAGLSEKVILAAIDSAPSYEFNVSPEGLIELSEAEVSTSILLHIQQLGANRNARDEGEAP